MTQKHLEDKLGEALSQILLEVDPGDFDHQDVWVKRLLQLINQHVEEVIGENEVIGLPVTQKQEQANYNKKQRNKLRAEQRARAGLEKGKENER